MSNVILPVVAIICLGVGIGVGSGIYSINDAPSTMDVEMVMDGEMAMDGGLSGTVDVGMLLPLTGGLSTQGVEIAAGAELAIDDFNEYLNEIDAGWQIRGNSEDTTTSPNVATEKLAALDARGIQVVFGPVSSAETHAAKGYADSNGMLMFGPSSSAPELAIPGDSVYRMTADDSNTALTLSALAQELGKTILIPVWRADTWGDGLASASSDSFAQSGGIVDDGIRYDPETADFSETMLRLDEKVAGYATEHGSGSVVVLLLAFAEALQIMQSASDYESLDDVQWFGATASAKEHKIINDPVGREFANAVSFTTPQIAASHNKIYERVNSELSAQFAGKEPNGFAITSYDAMWVLATAMLHTDSDDVEKLKAAIPAVAANNFGAIGSTELNEAGDLASIDYDLWVVQDDEWVSIGQYYVKSDTFTLNRGIGS